MQERKNTQLNSLSSALCLVFLIVCNHVASSFLLLAFWPVRSLQQQRCHSTHYPSFSLAGVEMFNCLCLGCSLHTSAALKFLLQKPILAYLSQKFLGFFNFILLYKRRRTTNNCQIVVVAVFPSTFFTTLVDVNT